MCHALAALNDLLLRGPLSRYSLQGLYQNAWRASISSGGALAASDMLTQARQLWFCEEAHGRLRLACALPYQKDRVIYLMYQFEKNRALSYTDSPA
jgi:hypothetical protein